MDHGSTAAVAGDEVGRFATDATGYRNMLAAGRRFSYRVWAVEGCNGIGKHLAQRLLADGETVVDVPAKLSARARVFSTDQGRKTDATDAHSIAVVAVRTPNLLRVRPDDHSVALRMLADRLWLGPPKTPASARTITLPPFLITRLREHLSTHAGPFVFTSPQGYPLRRSTFDRRVFRPAVDGDARKATQTIRPGLTIHGLRHSQKTWLIADGIPEIAQARRLGHHLSNRLIEVYSHVAPEIETRLLQKLERRWKHATGSRPADNRLHRAPRQRDPTPLPRSAPHPASPIQSGNSRSTPPMAGVAQVIQLLAVLQICSRQVHPSTDTDHGWRSSQL